MKNLKIYCKILCGIIIFGSVNSVYAEDVLILHMKNNSKKENKSKIKHKKIIIVSSFSNYSSIAKFLVQDKGEVSYISKGDQDPHFVPPKPSYAMMLKKADMWITTGMDLELWSTTLLDKARNKKIMDGEIGFVSASSGVTFLQKAEIISRTEGDIHPMGNPHIHTGPINWVEIATNITIGLSKVDPPNSKFYEERRDIFIKKVYKSIFGEDLLEIFDGKILGKLLKNGTLIKFLEKEYKGEVLITKLGGWLQKAMPFRNKKIIGYHKNWAYFTNTFGLNLIGYIEPKPGIPPSGKHVQYMIKLIKEQKVSIMLVANYYEKNSPRSIEEKTGIKAVFLPMSVYGLPEINDLFSLIDYWIDEIINNIE